MIKHNAKRLESINDNISLVKEYLGKLGEVQSLDKDVFWKALKKIIEKSKEGHKLRIQDTLAQKSDAHPGSTLSDVKFMAGCIQAYDEVLGIVEKNQELCDEASAKIKELQKVAEEVQTNIDLQ